MNQQEREYHKGEICCYVREIRPCVEGFCDQCDLHKIWRETDNNGERWDKMLREIAEAKHESS